MVGKICLKTGKSKPDSSCQAYFFQAIPGVSHIMCRQIGQRLLLQMNVLSKYIKNRSRK